MIMTKSLVTGIATCTALAVFAGNANAYKAHAHKTYRTTTTSTTGTYRGSVASGTRVNTSSNRNDPIYESCEYPWRHPDVGCPYGR
jgi:hypothetical protein